MWHQRHSPRRHSSRPTGSLEPFASELEQGPWERAREAAGIQMAKPQLEDEGAPQRRAVVAAPYQMLPHQTAHRSPVQEVVEPAVGHREPIDPMAQRPSEPGAERYGKAQLRVVQDLGRHEPADHTSEDVFPHAVADLQSRGQRERVLDERMVEQRDARLERDGHASPVHLGQNVSGEVGGDVHEHHLRREVPGAGGHERVSEDVAELCVPGHEAGGRHSTIDGCERERDSGGVHGLVRPRAIEQATSARRKMWKGVPHRAEY